MSTFDRVAIFYHPDCVQHETGDQHPERPERVEVIANSLRRSPFKDRLDWIVPKACDAQWIETVHTAEYRQFIEESCLIGKSTVDHGETQVCHESYRVACLAAGGATGAVDAVLRDNYSSAFSACRPPGHHARVEQAMGFCLFNNIAIAADYAKSVYGLERIAILDWDVHHGNGTQEIFYDSPSVLFCSTHQSPLYPHSGFEYEMGSKKAEGLTINCPIAAGSEWSDLKRDLEAEWIPVLTEFRPQLILLSAGFDAHRMDPLADLQLESNDYYEMTIWLRSIARDLSCPRIVSLLEGGYHLGALAESATAHVRGLIEDLPPGK